jgi:proteasome assembly chaperone (PAC2) family protein
MANYVLDMCEKLKVKRVYTLAAAIAKIHHTETPKVWAAATNQQLVEEMKQFNVVLRGSVQIAGLNGLFLGVAKERDIDGVCLLGEVPSYTTRIPNPKSALAVLNALSEILGIKVDTADLSIAANKADDEMKRMAAEAMGEFITSYTKPVWPQDEYDEDDEDDDEDDEEY